MEVVAQNFESLSYRQLQLLAKSRSVKANGKKQELVRRLVESEANQKKSTQRGMPTSSRSRQEAARDKENSAPVHKLKLQMTASPPLTKKALGRVDLNSPRANAPTSAAKSHKKTSINKSTAALTHLSETRVKTARVPVFAPANDAPADGGTSTENQTKYTLDRDAEHKDRGAKLRSKRDEKLAEVTEVVLESVTHEDPDGSKAATGTTTHHKEEGQDREQLRRRSCVPQLDVEFSAASEEIRDEVVVLATKANKTSRDVDTDATAAMGADDRKSFGTATPRLKEMPELPSESAACVQLFAEEIEQEKEKAQGMENQLTSSETQTVVDAGDDIPANSDDHANPSGTQGDTLRRRGDAAVDPSVGARPSCVHDEPLPTDFPADPVVATGKTHRAMIDDDTRRVVDGSQHLRFSKGGTRVLCTLTGQEIMPDYMEILNYLGSARVQQLSVEGPFVMSEYEGMFMVEDPRDANFVYCELTGARIFKSKAAVSQHVNGQLFKRAMIAIHAELALR